MADHMRRVFLSYSSEDVEEVDRFDLELRRRGVPLWRDRTDLRPGSLAETEIEKASREAAGFVFYLTLNASDSRWVREKERAHALENQKRWSGFGIVPIYREDIGQVTNRMQQQGEHAARDPGAYDLSSYTGYVIDPNKVQSPLDEELRQASDTVLSALLQTIGRRRGRGEKWKVGLMTREGPVLFKYPLDLLLDWTADYPPASAERPFPGFCRDVLGPALHAFRRAVVPHLPELSLQVVPQCHLTMALAFGFEFRRNVGISLEVREPHTGEIWLGPTSPLEPLHTAWKVEELPAGQAGSDVALAINITRDLRDFQREVGDYLVSVSPGVSQILYFEPTEGASTRVLRGREPDEIHRMVMAVLDRLLKNPRYQGSQVVHLFFAGPPGFAILLAQQLSNTRPVQTYEWSASRRTYFPGFELVSS